MSTKGQLFHSEVQASGTKEHKNIPSQLFLNILLLSKETRNKLWKSLVVLWASSSSPFQLFCLKPPLWTLRELVNLYNLCTPHDSNPVTTLSLHVYVYVFPCPQGPHSISDHLFSSLTSSSPVLLVLSPQPKSPLKTFLFQCISSS